MGRSLTGGSVGIGGTTTVGSGSGLTVIPSANLDLNVMVDVTDDFPRAVFNATGQAVYPLGWQGALNTAGGVVEPTKGYLGSCAGRGNELFYFGGSGNAYQVWKYTIDLDRWTQMAKSPVGIYSSSCEIIGDIIYIYGNIWLADTLWAYDTINDTWTQKTSNLGNGGYGVVSGVIGTKILYHGGYGYIQRPGGTKSTTVTYRATLWEYDTLLDTWAILPDSPQVRSRGSGGVIGADFICYGGTSNGSATTTDVWRYDTLTQFWWKLGGNYSSNLLATGAVYGDKLYSFGGYVGTTKYNWLWSHGITGGWANTSANAAVGAPQARYGVAMCAIGSSLYIVGGYTSSNVYDSKIYRYTLSAVATGPTYNIVMAK